MNDLMLLIVYLSTSSKEERETHIKEFIESLGTASNYGVINVFAKSMHGNDVILDCTEKENG